MILIHQAQSRHSKEKTAIAPIAALSVMSTKLKYGIDLTKSVSGSICVSEEVRGVDE
jgi:hypothetical protein